MDPCKKDNRRNLRPSNFSDYSLTDYIPGKKNTNVLQIITEFLDMLDQDFETRISEENSTIWLSMYALVS